MNEITRIHIAKIPYDIEVGAKKELEGYITKLKHYANDDELLTDIEIRITELLAERNVEKGGVITADDVNALRAQLGDPKDFLDDGDISVGIENDRPHRRYYRDIDDAIVGGVLSGIARYLNTDPLWTRLVFLILLFISFGSAIVVYVIVWAITPPARSAAEKLEMAGKPVTLASIKALNEQPTYTNDRPSKLGRQIVRFGAGAVMAFGALLSAVAIIMGAQASSYWSELSLTTSMMNNATGWVYPTIYALLIVSGLLLTALCTVIAVALFKWSWSKRTTVAVVAITVSGLVTFGSSIALYTYASAQDRAFVEGNQSVSQSRLPDGFSHVTNLSVDTGSTTAIVVYTVDSNTRYELRAMKDVYKPIIEVNGSNAKVSIKTLDTRRAQYSQPIVQIYGPALDSMTLQRGTLSYYNTQPSLSVTDNSGNVTIGGTFDTLVATTNDVSAIIDLSGASITQVVAHNQFGTISAGSIKNLTLTQPEACPLRIKARLSASAITSGSFLYNGVSQTASTMSKPCGEVTIGEDTE